MKPKCLRQNELATTGGRTYRRYELSDGRKEIKKKLKKDSCNKLIINRHSFFMPKYSKKRAAQIQNYPDTFLNHNENHKNRMNGRDLEPHNGEGVIAQLSKDLKKEMPQVEGLSVTNLRYCRRFYLLYSQHFVIHPQVEGEGPDNVFPSKHPQVGGELSVSETPHLYEDIFKIPWGHHKLIMDKVKGDVGKALFFVNQTEENGWSRALLLNWIDTGLYERSGKAITNFKATIEEPSSDLAQELTKDPYNFAFAGVTKRHNETQLKEALLANITNFLIELGTGFAYVGKEYRLQIGDTEKFIDLLFPNFRKYPLQPPAGASEPRRGDAC